MPDDVAEWLSAVCLLVCRSPHSVLEFRGPTLFDVPSSSTSKYNQPVNQSWQPWGWGCQMEFALDPLNSWLVFPACKCIQIVRLELALQTPAGGASRLISRQRFGVK